MKISDFMKIFASERRMEVLDALLMGKKKDEIKECVPTSTFAFTIDYLKKVGFAQGADGEVSLTDRGHAYLIIFEKFKEGIHTLQRIYDFFPDHNIFFPDEFLIRLDELNDFEPVASEPSDVLKPHRVFAELLKNSNDIRGVSPLMFPDYPILFKAMAENMQSISLVVTREVYEIISEYPIDEFKNIDIHIIEETPQIAVTVTDTFLSIGFFYKSGSYDFTRDMVCKSPQALQFGRDLVEYHRRKSLKIT
jgi:predicted transcriptional regulator